MSRLKFKGYHLGLKKMISAETLGKDQLTLSADGRGFINVSGNSVHESVFIKNMIPLQFTGAIDIKNIEIYEGDIMQTKYGLIVFVEWNNLDFQFHCYEKSRKHRENSLRQRVR